MWDNAPNASVFTNDHLKRVVLKVFCRKSLTEPKILGITIFGTSGMGTADREIMSIVLLRQHIRDLAGCGVVNQDLIVIPLGR
jgi:hypothetical protein